jgi:hypothetical protein
MGSGMSDGSFEEMTFSTELEDARALIEYALSIKKDVPLYVLGFSCGGAVAACMSREYKEKIAKLVLCAPAGNMDKLGEARLTNPSMIWYDDNNVDMGGYLLSKNFMLGFKKDNIDLYKDVETFKNPVLISNYPVDIHSSSKDSSTLEKVNVEYQLPLESLMVEDFDDVFVIGRCISADFKAQAALRIIPSCFSMGEGLAKYLAGLKS